MKKNNNLKVDFYDIFYNSALFLLLDISVILIFTCLLFILKVSVLKYSIIFYTLISIILFLYFKGNNLKNSLISICVGLFIFVISVIFIGNIYDATADGNTYHKLAVGALKNGWNPVYESVSDFNIDEGNPFDIYEDNVNVKWVDHYAKGTEIFASVIYSFTGNIEAGKVYNILWIYIGFFILSKILLQYGLSKWKSLFLSFVMAFNPIILTQVVNYYLDGVLAITMFIIILGSLLRQKKLSKKDLIENYIVVGLSLVWCINSKFTGLAFAAVFCGLIWIYQNIRNYLKNKNYFKEFIIKDTLFYVISVFVAVCIVGSNSYVINTINNGNPLYPLYGKGHVENMVLKEMPKSMQGENNLKIFLTSIFSVGENCSPSYSDVGNEPDLKIPFTISRTEINNYSIPDIRIGGFGPLFSGVFVLTSIGFVIMIVLQIKRKEWDYLIPLLIITITTFALILLLDGSYWARYIPYFYLMPIYVLMYFLKFNYKKNKLKNIFAFIVIGILIINSCLIGYTQVKTVKSTNEYISIRIDNFKDYSDTNEFVYIKLSHHGIQGVLYNLDDLKINNYILTDDDLEGRDCYMFNF